MTSEVGARVSRCFLNVFPGLPAEEIPKASVASLARWDSLAHVTLLMAIEEEFSLVLSPLDFEELTSYALIVDCVESQAGHG
jgi:acyl carrier protein